MNFTKGLLSDIIFHHIFISHAWKYNDDYYTVIGWLDNSNMGYKNYSVPEHDPIDTHNTKKLKEQLTEQIRHASIVIIIGGMYVAYSDWIDYELDEAKRMNKKIILLRPRGQERMSFKATLYADKIVGWNSTSLINAIKELQ